MKIGAKKRNPSKLHAEETHLDVSKAKGLQDSPYFLQGDEDDIFEHDGKGSGSAFQNHEKRKPDFGAFEFTSDGKRSYSSGRRFAINSKAESHLSLRINEGRIQEHFLDQGVDGAEYFLAEGFLSPHEMSIGDTRRISNESVKKDNYEFVLRNTHLLKANIAKTLLAKMDIDRDVVGTLSDMLSNKSSWAKNDPDLVLRELKNRLRLNSKEQHPEYEPIFKILDKIHNVEEKNEKYKILRLKGLEDNINNIVDDISNKTYGFEHEDDEQRENVKGYISESFLSKHSPAMQKNMDYGEYLAMLLRKEPDNDFLYKINKYIEDENPLLGKKQVLQLHAEAKEIERIESDFIDTHNASTTTSTNIINRFGYHSNHLPIPLLAALADESFATKNFSEALDGDEWTPHIPLSGEKKYEELERSIKDLVKGANDTEIKSIIEDMKSNLSKNKEEFEYLYNPKVDNIDTQRRHYPFELTSHYDQDAQNIMRDALYLSIFKHKNKEIWEDVYANNEDTQRGVVLSSLDKDALKARPKMDEVNDLYNGVLLITKSSSATISDDAVDKLIESQLFKDSSVFNEKDLAGIKSYSKSLSRESERLREKDIYGVPEEKELHAAIQEMRYLDAANSEIEKVYGGSVANQLKSTFFMNNKIIHDLSVCMEAAKSPTNHVETVPSMTKGCLEKMKQAHEKMKEEMDKMINSREAAFAGVTPLGTLLIIASIKSSANAYKADRIVEEVNKIVAEDIAYVDSAGSSQLKAARKMNIDVDSLGIGGHIVKDGFQNKFIQSAEREHTIRDIVLNSANDKLDKPFIINSLFSKERDEALSLLENEDVPENRNAEKILALQEELRELLSEEKTLEASLGKEVLNDNAHLKEVFKSIKDAEEALEKEEVQSDPQKVLEVKEKAEELKKELEEMLTDSPHVDNARLKEVLKSIKDAEEALEKEEVQSDPQKVLEVKEKAEELKKELEEMLTNTPLSADMSRLNSIKADILRRSDLLGGLEGSMGGGNDESLEIRVKNLFKSKGGFSTLALDTKDPSLRLGLIRFLGVYRDTLNKRVLYTPDDAESKNINKELEKINQVLPQLHREAIYDRSTYGNVIDSFIKDKYQVSPSDEVISMVGKEGLSDNVIGKLMENVREKEILTEQKERSLFFDLKESQRARRLLNPRNGEITSLAASGTITSYLEQFNRFENKTGKVIHDSNDFHAAVSQSSNGNYYVVGGKGRIGLYLSEAEKYQKEGNYEKLTQLNKASAHLDMHGRVNSEAVTSYLNKISYENNSVAQANTDLLRKSMLSNRAAREKNAKVSAENEHSPSMKQS